MSQMRKAACVVLYRPSGPEILLTRRAETLAFLGGFDAFPGGSVDAADRAVALDGPYDDHELRVAALRELFEETGVLIADGALDASERVAMRRALIAGADFAAELARYGLRLRAKDLVPMGRWVTPPYAPARFDALYFAAALPAGEHADIWPGELTRGIWATASEALARHQRGELFITFPVLETLRCIAAVSGDMTEAGRRMTARGYESYPHAGGEMLAGLYMAPQRTPTLPPATHTNTYVLGGEDLVVVDPATPYEDEQARLVAFLEHLEGQGGKVREIWLTHHHPDHVGAVELVRRRFSVPVFAHAQTAESMAGEVQVDRLLEDGDRLNVRGPGGITARWMALHTPGHTRGHLCFYEERLGTLISGDLVLGFGTVLVAPPDGDMRDYMASLERLLTMRIGFVFPAHGPPVAAAHHKVKEYIAHRTTREDAILAAVRAGAGTTAEIVRVVYTDVAPAALPLAELNVRAHLDKLVAEGRVQLMAEGYAALPG